jgi:hypothetical protein
MTPADAARLLALVQAFDHRTVGETDAIAWADALNDLDAEDCAEAIRDHYRHRADWLMPAHVRGYVVRKQRDDAERRHALSLRQPPIDYDRQHAAYQQAVAALRARLEATT